ncbi:MAG TPA: protein phosphatase 2C domain-containing protein [Kofleriaceae bacterium]|nr:protein phosphatase 2C domain-containing protein [Kofleriaceae bacterium]
MEPVQVSAYAVTDAGLVRDTNEDWFAVGDLDRGSLAEAGALTEVTGARGPLFVVCDGMGGVAGGEVASRLAVETVWQEMLGSRATEERPVYARLLRRAIRAAHRRVLEEGVKRPELRGMGTTVSAAGLAGDALILAQVGDSRAYIERHGTLTQVTRDQSVVSALVHAGRISETEARLSEKRSLILQALGTGEDVDVALSLVELRRGDRLLLCSDGLHGPVGDEALRHALAEHEDLGAAVDALVRLARQAGAPDNVTVVLARFAGDRLPLPGEGDAPRFTELDPNEEGESALTNTSYVARRLAARAGLRRSDSAPPPIPATGQHRAVRLPDELERALAARRKGRGAPAGPASEALARGARLGLVAWVIVGVAAVVFLGLLLWDAL